MNFTREPIIETVISPKEGYKLLVRSSKGSGQEEFFVDALEVITFGKNCFYRSLEKPKSFLVPVADYEILEVREARMVLKATGVERVKIGGGREGKKKEEGIEPEALAEQKTEKRREKRKTRKKRAKSEEEVVEEEKERPLERPSLIPPPSTLIRFGHSEQEEEPEIPLEDLPRDEEEVEEETT